MWVVSSSVKIRADLTFGLLSNNLNLSYYRVIEGLYSY